MYISIIILWNLMHCLSWFETTLFVIIINPKHFISGNTDTGCPHGCSQTCPCASMDDCLLGVCPLSPGCRNNWGNDICQTGELYVCFFLFPCLCEGWDACVKGSVGFVWRRNHNRSAVCCQPTHTVSVNTPIIVSPSPNCKIPVKPVPRCFPLTF